MLMTIYDIYIRKKQYIFVYDVCNYVVVIYTISKAELLSYPKSLFRHAPTLTDHS